MPKLFGTDGVRGIAGVELTSDLAARLGEAAGKYFVERTESNKPTLVVGRDTRASGPELTEALAAGLNAAGMTVIDAGVLPTPAVAFLVTDLLVDAGAVVSASHNPSEYNGIKFFGATGFKLSEAEEEVLESILDDAPPPNKEPLMDRMEKYSDLKGLYLRHVFTSLEGRSLAGLKVVLDCANGAAYETSPRALADAGAEVVTINNTPNGTNINESCGSTHPEGLIDRVKESGADVGLAHDGDADRLIAVDETGELVDGDSMLAVLAAELKESGRLQNNLIVATVMANLGFRNAMKMAGIELAETPVGDRYVLETMHERGASLGGEQSGHIIFSEYATTGDGLITSLRLLGRMVSAGKKLSELAAIVEKCPQLLLNVPVSSARSFKDAIRVKEAVAEAEKLLGDEGRILVRPSGTEPVVRVMVEALEESMATSVAHEVARVVEEELGGDV